MNGKSRSTASTTMRTPDIATLRRRRELSNGSARCTTSPNSLAVRAVIDEPVKHRAVNDYNILLGG